MAKEPHPTVQKLSPVEILSTETELIRCLILLLIGKKLVSESEVMMMAKFAKERLLSMHEPTLGPGAARYVDHLLRTLQPDAPTPPHLQQ